MAPLSSRWVSQGTLEIQPLFVWGRYDGFGWRAGLVDGGRYRADPCPRGSGWGCDAITEGVCLEERFKASWFLMSLLLSLLGPAFKHGRTVLR